MMSKDFERKRRNGAVSGSATSSKRYSAFHTVPQKQPVSPRYGLKWSGKFKNLRDETFYLRKKKASCGLQPANNIFLRQRRPLCSPMSDCSDKTARFPAVTHSAWTFFLIWIKGAVSDFGTFLQEVQRVFLHRIPKKQPVSPRYGLKYLKPCQAPRHLSGDHQASDGGHKAHAARRGALQSRYFL